MENIRLHIKDDTFLEYKDSFIERYITKKDTTI